MKVEQICALPVAKVAADNAHLYLWTTNNYLRRAFEVVDAWGFQYITTLTWRKLGRQGLGQYFRGTTEHVLFCRRGCPPYRTREDGKRAQGLTDFEAGAYFDEARPEDIHSRKPTKVHEWAELISPGPYLEMFARTARPGWQAWGNEAPSILTLEDLL
jgi:N6-adenosine-specific RNA methylase IME4